jgi:hypothetical protein
VGGSFGKKCWTAVEALASWGAGTLTRPGKRDSLTSRSGLRKQGELQIPTVPEVRPETTFDRMDSSKVDGLRQWGALVFCHLCWLAGRFPGKCDVRSTCQCALDPAWGSHSSLCPALVAALTSIPQTCWSAASWQHTIDPCIAVMVRHPSFLCAQDAAQPSGGGIHRDSRLHHCRRHQALTHFLVLAPLLLLLLLPPPLRERILHPTPQPQRRRH